MVEPLKAGDRLGIIGGGQLGRMLAIAARPFGLKVIVWDPDTEAPAACVADQHLCAPFDDEKALATFIQQSDRATYEFENIPLSVARALEAKHRLLPDAKALEVSQDRLIEKQYMQSLGLEVAPFWDIHNKQALNALREQWPGDSLLKTRRLGYDGKGQYAISAFAELDAKLAQEPHQAFILEGKVNFASEASVILSRAIDGTITHFSVTDNHHHEGILRRSSVPSRLNQALQDKAIDQAKTLANSLDYVGTLAVEFFVTQSQNLLINEFAPRVHNSGHWTLNGDRTCQFSQHIRAVSGWSLAAPELIAPIEMINLIGDDIKDNHLYLQDPNARLHLYGKRVCKAGRKMGHVNRFISR